MEDAEETPLAGAAMSSLKARVLSSQDGARKPRTTGEADVVETHQADADSAMTMEVEDVVEAVAVVVVTVAEEAVETASDATRKVTWLANALMRTRDLLGDPWNASSATKMVIWLETAQLVTVAAVVVVTTTTRGHAVMQMMEATPGLRTEEETTTMTTVVVVEVEAVAGVELPAMTWTTLGARPTTTMLVMTGAVIVVIKVEE